MNKNTDFEDDLEGLDLSVLNGGDISSTPGLEMNLGDEIDSIDVINGNIPNEQDTEEPKKVEKPSKTKTPKAEEPEEEEEVIEEEEEPEIEKSIKDTPVPEITGRVSALRVFAEMQREKGIIDYSDEEFEDSDEFILSKVQEKIEKDVQSGIDEYKNSFTPEARDLIEAIEAGIPLESLVEKNSTISAYENINDSDIDDNESLQKNLIRNLYFLKGYSAELIDKKIQRWDDSGLLADEAKDARIELLDYAKKEKEEAKKQQIIAQKERAEKFESWKNGIKTYLEKTEEIIPGFKISPRQKEIIQNGLTKFDKEGKNDFQKMMEKDPNFNTKVAYIALALNWDFSGFDKRAATKVAKGLKDALRDDDKLVSGSGGYNHTKSNVNLGVMEKALRLSK
jgi:hypothetical protein